MSNLSPHHRRSSTPSGSTRASPSAYFNRNFAIPNFNSWFTELNISPLSILQTLASPFRRRSGRTSSSSPPSPATIRRSRSASYTTMIGDDDSDFEFDRPVSDFLSGSLQQTAKSKELIELAPFGFVEVENVEKGVGHHFEVSGFYRGSFSVFPDPMSCFQQPYQWSNPTWCDSCGDFLWTPVNFENCVNPKSHFQAVSCSHCRYTCHVRCRRLVRIDCQGRKENGTLVKPLPTKSVPAPLPDPSVLEAAILAYNSRLKNKGSGLGITLLESGNFRGFIRVHLNLTRPINVVAGTRPPSIYDIIKGQLSNHLLRLV